MKKWNKTIATVAIAFTAALTLASCGDDSSSDASTSSDKQNSDISENFSLTRGYAVRFDTLDGKPYFIRYTPDCFYRDKKFVLDVDSTLYLYLYDIKKDSLHFKNLSKEGDKFIEGDYGSLFFGDNKTIFGTWEDQDCFVDYDTGEIECDEDYFDRSLEITKDSIVFIQTFPKNFLTDIIESESMRNILYYLLNLSDNDAKAFRDDAQKVYKEKKVKVVDRDTYKAHISVDNKEVYVDFTDTRLKDDLREINVIVSHGQKTCKGHSETSLMPWKYCSEEYKDKLFIFEDMVDYASNNDKEFYPCLSKLLK